MANFNQFNKLLMHHFEKMAKQGLYYVPVDKDQLWNLYLDSFPSGTNEIHIKNREHDCSCCRHFIKNIGSVVSIKDGKITTIWDFKCEEPYSTVVKALADKVRHDAISLGIENVYRHSHGHVGTESNIQVTPDGNITWKHFYVKLPEVYVTKDLGTILGLLRTKKDVMYRALDELTLEATDTILELIDQKSLYRGEEHKHTLTEFRNLKKKFSALPNKLDKDLFCWSNVESIHGAISGIRNSAIGTLLQDLSEDKDLEESVKSFEAKVAPANYKRPTSLVSKKQIEEAKKTIEELGLQDSLDRRYATLEDISVNNIIFANSESKKLMKNVFDELIEDTPINPKTLSRVEEISIDDFINKVVPKVKNIEVLVENRHSQNFVSLIAPVDSSAKSLFKWPNPFSWCYTGELADSDLTRAVQARGGNINGAFRFSHQWNYGKRNASLMDLHVFMPGSSIDAANYQNDIYGTGRRVGWNRRNDPQSGGTQDVDYTVAAPEGYVPCENIVFPDLKKMPEGTYICKIHNWNLRNPTQGGFKAEIAFGGQVFQYEVDRPLKNKEWVTVAEVTLKAGVFTIKHHLPHGQSSKTIWDIPTETFRKVNVMMLSPNHWDNHQIGNKHYFLMLDGCNNTEKVRGFFNEQLSSELDKHRKVLEIVGSKMKTDESDRQLSGLGFSSTKKDHFIVRVTGSITRNLKVTI